MRTRPCLILIVALLLNGCIGHAPGKAIITPSGMSSVEALPAEEARRYALQPGDTVEQPTLIDHPAPAYPAEVIDRHLPPLQFDVRITVDAVGMVSSCEPLAPTVGDPDDAPFFAAIRVATSSWHFTPLRVTRLEDVDDNGDGEVDRVRQSEPIAMPFSLDYRFRFSVIDGKAQVEQAKTR